MPPINKQKGYSIPIQLAKVLEVKAVSLGLTPSDAVREAGIMWLQEKCGMTLQEIFSMEVA